MNNINKISGKNSLIILSIIDLLSFSIMGYIIIAEASSDEYSLSSIFVMFLIMCAVGWYSTRCAQVIPLGYCAIILRMERPLNNNNVYMSGTHAIIYGFDEFVVFPNDEQIISYKKTFDKIATWNKTYLVVDVNVQYILINPLKRIHQNLEGLKSTYYTSINQSISNYINENKITNAMVFSHKNEMENRIKNDLGIVMNMLGEEIVNLSINTSPQDEEWITIWRKQSEIDYFTERLIKLSKSTGVDAEEAFEQTAVKEGWIKPNENIYKIKDASKIINMVNSFLTNK